MRYIYVWPSDKTKHPPIPPLPHVLTATRQQAQRQQGPQPPRAHARNEEEATSTTFKSSSTTQRAQDRDSNGGETLDNEHLPLTSVSQPLERNSQELRTESVSITADRNKKASLSEAPYGKNSGIRGDTSPAQYGRSRTRAGGVLCPAERSRPSTAPIHTDGKVAMRPLGLHGGINGDPPSVAFEPGYSRLRTRRIILDR